ncbi:MAG: hypothetical protein PHE67_03790 [Campylobacterales bacterium]|nr:hypothetical protein [Campylobacterales bacterium]
MDKKTKEYLEATAQAMNSVAIIEKLKQRILDTHDTSNIPKKPRQFFQDEAIQKIYDTLYEFLTPGYFWEDFIFMICNDIEIYDFTDTSSVGYVTQTDRANVIKRLKPQKSICYEKISLKEHTLNIIESFLKNYDSITQSIRFEVLCSCVLHDFGKSSALMQSVDPRLINETYEHAQFSCNYVLHLKKKIIKQFNGQILNDQYYENQLTAIDRMAKGVLHHHKNTRYYGEIAYQVGIIDQKTREKEWYDHLG